MRYINLYFTYLLTYSRLTECCCCYAKQQSYFHFRGIDQKQNRVFNFSLPIACEQFLFFELAVVENPRYAAGILILSYFWRQIIRYTGSDLIILRFSFGGNLAISLLTYIFSKIFGVSFNILCTFVSKHKNVYMLRCLRNLKNIDKQCVVVQLRGHFVI